jgi:mannose/fructose/N-acetylgalactosamine-specific phosphotransferase system component IID
MDQVKPLLSKTVYVTYIAFYALAKIGDKNRIPVGVLTYVGLCGSLGMTLFFVKINLSSCCMLYTHAHTGYTLGANCTD